MEALKEEIINKLEEYLRDRMQINDRLRLKNQKATLTTDEIYVHYLQQEEKRFIAINKTKLGIWLGEKIKFTQEEIDKIFAIVKEYLSKIAITEFPNSRGDTNFLADVLKEILKSQKLEKEKTEEIKKYIVSLDCLASALDFTNEIEGDIYSASGRFVVQDYSGKSFIKYDAKEENNNGIKDFTRVYLNEDLDVIHVEDKNTKETMTIFGIEKETEIDSCISSKSLEPNHYKKEEYTILSKTNIEKFLTDINCTFLKRDLYDNFTMRTIAKNIDKYNIMSQEKKEELHRIATIAAKFSLECYENDYCSKSPNKIPDNFSQANEFAEGIRSRDEIKSTLLDIGWVRISLHLISNPTSIIRRAAEKAGIWVSPIFEEIMVTENNIIYSDKYHNDHIIYSCDANKRILR